MQRIIEVKDGGLQSMLGKKITLFCMIYIYTGKLIGVSEDHVELESPLLVYETGELAVGCWEDAQKLPGVHRVMRAAIESWGPAKC